MEDIPNGFTGFSRKRPGFESAGDAIRKSKNAQEYGHSPSIDLSRDQTRAAQAGWQVPSYASPITGHRTSAWGKAKELYPEDVKRYLRVPDVAKGEEAPVFDFDMLDELGEDERRWAWVEVDLGAIHSNTLAARSLLAPGTLLMAVVKGDAYGHGAVEVARTALNAGADYLGVATVDEAVELRKADIWAPILILSEPPISSIPLLLGYQVMPSVDTIDFALKYAEAADSVGLRAPYHLKINTGMNRIGVRFDEVVEFMRRISFHRALDLVGTYTHFATADMSDTMEFRIQTSHFVEAIAQMREFGIDPGIIHAANSAATIRFPEVHFDMVRFGISLYGYYPCPETFGRIELIPAMSVHARITHVKNVPVGEGVSYGLYHRSAGFAKTCTVPIGYADGLRRGLSDNTDFILDGEAYPQVGAICMDQSMFEVDLRLRSGGERANPEIGDEVLIVGAEGDAIVSIDEMAEKLGTIPYEICLGFGCSRLPKVYTT